MIAGSRPVNSRCSSSAVARNLGPARLTPWLRTTLRAPQRSVAPSSDVIALIRARLSGSNSKTRSRKTAYLRKRTCHPRPSPPKRSADPTSIPFRARLARRRVARPPARASDAGCFQTGLFIVIVSDEPRRRAGSHEPLPIDVPAHAVGTLRVWIDRAIQRGKIPGQWINGAGRSHSPTPPRSRNDATPSNDDRRGISGFNMPKSLPTPFGSA